jgi:hypothetical protein
MARGKYGVVNSDTIVDQLRKRMLFFQLPAGLFLAGYGILL